MKKAIVTIITIATFGAGIFSIGKNDGIELYAETAKVISVENDVVAVETSTGHIFTFKGAEDWEIGDCASLIMNSRETQYVDDDEIIKADYSSWQLERTSCLVKYRIEACGAKGVE